MLTASTFIPQYCAEILLSLIKLDYIAYHNRKMKKEVLEIETIHQCNCFFEEKTLHPLVGVVDLSKTNWEHQKFLKLGFYAVLLEECPHEYFIYGRKKCDFSDGTLLFFSPGETIEIVKNNELFTSKGWLLTFHPELIKGTSLSLNMENYTFFNYQKEEALHISLREKNIIRRCLENIKEELHWAIDKYSRILVSKQIELLLDYCTRFYTRQFITRYLENKKLIAKVEHIVDDYFLSNKTNHIGLPTAKQCACKLHLSADYLEDLLKHDTGKTMYEYVQSKRMDLALKWLKETNKTVEQITKELGFSSVSYFNRLFKKIIGISPDDYKIRN